MVSNPFPLGYGFNIWYYYHCIPLIWLLITCFPFFVFLLSLPSSSKLLCFFVALAGVTLRSSFFSITCNNHQQLVKGWHKSSYPLSNSLIISNSFSLFLTGMSLVFSALPHDISFKVLRNQQIYKKVEELWYGPERIRRTK